MKINLNNRKFKTLMNSDNGEVSSDTIFHYRQQDHLVWAEYNGGKILKGFLIGTVSADHITFTYQHVNLNFEIMTGKCKSYPELLKNNKLQLKEYWQWTCNDFARGQSTIIEI